jgi:hypothetical protein
MSYNQTECGGIWHATNVTRCATSKTTNITVAIIQIFLIKQHRGKVNVKFYEIYFLLLRIVDIHEVVSFIHCQILVTFSNM